MDTIHITRKAVTTATVLCIAVLIAAVSSAFAADTVPLKMNYQARLKQSGTAYTGTQNMTFKIYDAATTGTVLWTETQTAVPFTNGLSSTVVLGSITPLPATLFDDASVRYLEVTIGDTTLSPREAFYSVPYAFNANKLKGKETATTNTADALYVSDSAGMLPANVVSSHTIVDGSITSVKIASAAISNAHISATACISPTKLDAGSVSIDSTTFGYLSGATSNIQTQINTINTSLGTGPVVKAPSAEQVIQPTANVSPLVIKAYTGQTAALLTLKDSSGVSIASFSSAGNLSLGSGLTVDGVDISAHAASSNSVHGLGSDSYIVGTTTTQTLTNKTLGDNCTWSGNAISATKLDSTVARSTDVTTHAGLTETHNASGPLVGQQNVMYLYNKYLYAGYGNHISAVVIDSDTLNDARLSSSVTKLGQTIEGSEIAQRTIGTYNIAAGTVTANEMAYKTIVATNIADGVLTADKLYTGTIVSTSIAASAIATANLANNAVTNAKIADGSISATKLGSDVTMLTAGAVTNLHIAEDAAISPSKVYANGVSISSAEFSYLDTVSSNIQTQFTNVQTQFTNLDTQFNNKVSTSPSSAQTIQPTADVTPLSVKAKSGQTAALFAAKDVNGNSLAYFDTTGNLTFNGVQTVDGVRVSTHVAGSSGVHGLSTNDGYVVGTTKTQTVTNKTLGTGCTWSGNAISASSIAGMVSTTTFVSHTVARSTHGVFSDIVGSTDTQTLTNKTMDNSNHIDVRALETQGEGDDYKIADALIRSNILRSDTANIPGTAIATAAISSRTLADGAVYSRHLTTTEAVIQNSSQILQNKIILTGHLGDLAVANQKLAEGAVTAGKIQDAAVTANKIAEGVIYSTHIAAGQVKEANLANYAVTKNKIAVGVLDADLIADGAIVNRHISEAAKISPFKVYAEDETSTEVHISTAEFGRLQGVSSNIQTQLNNKVSTSPATAQAIQATADVIPLSVKAYSGQTAALFAVKDAGGVLLASFTSAGNLSLASGLTVDGVDISAHAAASSGVHGLATGSHVVGESEDQTLTYKEMGTGCTWTGPNIDVSKITGALSSTDFENHRDTHIAHGVFSDVVGSTDTQTLTNKTITGATINTPAINTATLTVSSMTTSTITATAIYTSVIGSNNSIDADAINSGTIETAYIADNAITGNKIGAGVIYSTHIANSQVKTENIDTEAVTAPKIAQGVVYSTHIANYQVKAVNIDTDAVTTDKIAADAVTLGKISPQIVSGFIAKNSAGATQYTCSDGGTVTLRANSSKVSITSSDGVVLIDAMSGVATVEATDGLYKTDDGSSNYTFHVGTTPTGGVIVVGSSVTVDLDFAPTWTEVHTFNVAPSFAASGTPFSVSGTNKVTNLNADTVDSAGVNDAGAASTSVLWTSDKINTTFLPKAGGTMTGTLSGTDVALTYGISAATASFTGNISMGNGATVDGRDISLDGIRLDGVRTSTGVIQVQVNSIAESTGTIQTQVTSIAASTGTMQTQVTNIANSTGTMQTQVTNIANSTGTMQTQVTNIANSTGTIQTQVNNIAVSTAAIAVSTGTLVKKAGDTMTGALNMGGQLITGIGTKYSSFTATGLDMNTGYIENIGVAGTDFTSSGGLTLANTLTVSAGGAHIIGISTITSTANGNMLNVTFNTNVPGFGVYQENNVASQIYAFGAAINGEKDQVSATNIHYYRLLGVEPSNAYKAPLQTDSTGGTAFTFTAAKAGNIIFDFEQTNNREFRITNAEGGDGTKRADLVLDDGYIKQYYTPTTSNNLLAGTTFYGIVVATAAPTGTGVGQGSLYINPASASSDYTLFGAAVGGTQKMRVDKDGNMTLSGAIQTSSATFTSTTSTSTFQGGVKVEQFFTSTKAPTAGTTGFFLNPATDTPNTGVIFGIADNNSATQIMSVTGDGVVWIGNANISALTFAGNLTPASISIKGSATLVDKISDYGPGDDGVSTWKLKVAKVTSAGVVSGAPAGATDGYYAVYAP